MSTITNVEEVNQFVDNVFPAMKVSCLEITEIHALALLTVNPDDLRLPDGFAKVQKCKTENGKSIPSVKAIFCPNRSYKSEIGFAKVKLGKVSLESQNGYKSEILFAKVRLIFHILKGLA